MSRNNVNTKQPLIQPQKRIRKISTTSRGESEVSGPGEESTRLTIDGDDAAEDDLVSYSDYQDVPAPPDGGYGWVIVIASFFCNMIVDGIAYTFGIFLGRFEVFFGEGKGKTAWVGSLLSGMYLSCGPVVSALTNKYGCRKVCIAGSIIGCLAFALSTKCQNINQLMIVYGVVGGIGFGLIYLPAVVCVGYYFETKRSLATGIAVCGSGVGTFAFAPLATYLIEEYSWQGGNLILAGLILNCALFGALMRPLEASGNNQIPLLQRMADEKRYQMERGSIGGSYFIVQLPDGSMEKRMKMPINIDPGVHSSLNLDQLVPGTPITPVPTMAVLPTITEVKLPEQSGSSNNSSSELKLEKNKKELQIEGVKEVTEEEEVLSKTDEDEKKDEQESLVDDDSETIDEKSKNIEVKGSIPRNASQPAFTTHVQGLHKNGSVPNFDRIRKTSASERYRPSLGPIKVSKSNVNSNGDVRKSLQLRLTGSSNVVGSKGNVDDMWSKTDMDQDGVSFSASKQSIKQPKKDYIRPMSRKDIFYSGSILNLPEYQSQKSLATYRQSVLSIPRYSRSAVNIGGSTEDVEEGEQCSCTSLPVSVRTVLGSMLDITLLKDPVFLLIGMSNFFGMAGLYVPFVYLIEAAQSNGIPESKASFLVSIIGIIGTVGRVFFGFIADFPSVNSLLLNNICLLVCTFSVFAIPFCLSYSHYVSVAIFFGASVSGYISLTSIILVDLLGLDKLTNAFGLLILFRGAAAIVGSPLAGMVYDKYRTYTYPFVMAAVFFLISTLFSFMAPFIQRCLQTESQVETLDVLTPIDEDEEDEEEEEGEDDDEGLNTTMPIPEIVETMSSPLNNDSKSPPLEIKQIESVL